MVIRQRAIQAEDKQERHHAILDAAARLLRRSPERIANVADVADEAGLAKGTVYLYFPSKEELLLALHERNIDGFFRALVERLAQRRAGRRSTTSSRSRTSTWSSRRCSCRSRRAASASWAQSVPVEAAIAFKQRMAERLMARRRRARAPLLRAHAGRRRRAAAPQLRADPRPVADVGGVGRPSARMPGGDPGRARARFQLFVSRGARPRRCSRCGAAPSARAQP